jgi:hypothetical protein
MHLVKVTKGRMSSSLLADEAETKNHLRSYRVLGVPIWGAGCALVLLAAILVAHPYAEVGISDDFSYIRIAQVLAQTGHVAYTGWVTPILGWQLYLAALFIKLFGFSFTTTRASIMFVSVVTAFLCQRTFVRAGVNEWNASIGTLTLLLSPLLMPLEVTYMTDIPGLFATILCLYACLRGIQSGTSRGAIAWIGSAALSNVAFGSSRQIAWLAGLVMVPSALWILRKNRRVVMIGFGFWILSAALIFGINHWFEHQPYTQVEPLIDHRIYAQTLYHFSEEMLRACFEVVLLLLPVLLMFLPALWRKRHPWQVYLAGILFVLGGLRVWQIGEAGSWSAPYLGGVLQSIYLGRLRPVSTVAVAFCILALLTAVLTRREGSVASCGEAPCVSNRMIGILIVPFLLAYLGLISPRAGFEGIWDRYLVPLLFVGLIFVLRFYQQRFRTRVPVAALVLALCFGAYATASLHDRMAMYRARAGAVNEVLATGVPATSISGGWDYDGWTELQLSSHIIDHRMRMPPGMTLPKPTHYGLADCPWFYCNMFPHVVPYYTISLRPDPIPGSSFAPVPYRTWVDPPGTVYVVRFPDRSVGGHVP